ncbi:MULTISPECIES: hypothetical protein [Delftia]|uniref:Lipoprotein n=1 Tax=Delftia deserti TaxID=1651218 RepID=A0ABW5EUX8_9BURK|nr:hypothetical protein [Delftia tsuruhatensis]MBL8355578.1 hypothetical protein [Delftia acidovorans]MCX7509449.1 hypothetical protein [Delftia tsuruhatensis]
MKWALIAAACATLVACGEKPAPEQVAPAVAAPVSGLELWGGAVYGMTPQEVKATSAEVVDAEQAPESLYNGASKLLERQGVVVANTKFNAKYYFLNDRLHQVTLGLGEKKVYSEAELAGKQIREALTSKYGDPLSCEHFSGTITKGYSCNWKRPGGNVSMFLAAVDEASPTLNIVYQVRLAQDASKL